ncbi:Leucine-tRNA ligase [Trinorchestia longiramus]|nr:Leucine-tRNA ligase [Trinorchestia longiramus]
MNNYTHITKSDDQKPTIHHFITWLNPTITLLDPSITKLDPKRSWGAPIPVVHCSSCGCVPVPDAELPVLLPCHVPGASDSAFADLRNNEQFKNCICPQCGGAAERETDTMDTFVDSCWYFLRFLDAQNREKIFDRSLADSGMPVDLYIGGEEHAVLHLYYARFMQHFLQSEGLTSHTEPFNR